LRRSSASSSLTWPSPPCTSS